MVVFIDLSYYIGIIKSINYINIIKGGLLEFNYSNVINALNYISVIF